MRFLCNGAGHAAGGVVRGGGASASVGHAAAEVSVMWVDAVWQSRGLSEQARLLLPESCVA